MIIFKINELRNNFDGGCDSSRKAATRFSQGCDKVFATLRMAAARFSGIAGVTGVTGADPEATHCGTDDATAALACPASAAEFARIPDPGQAEFPRSRVILQPHCTRRMPRIRLRYNLEWLDSAQPRRDLAPGHYLRGRGGRSDLVFDAVSANRAEASRLKALPT